MEIDYPHVIIGIAQIVEEPPVPSTDKELNLLDIYADYVHRLCTDFVQLFHEKQAASKKARKQHDKSVAENEEKLIIQVPSVADIRNTLELDTEWMEDRSPLVTEWLPVLFRLLHIPEHVFASLNVHIPVSQPLAYDTRNPTPTKNDSATIESFIGNTVRARNRYRVFRDLHQRQFMSKYNRVLWEPYLSYGGKFGGDFCLYPGDPFRYHSAAVVQVVPFNEDTYIMRDLIQWARLSHTAKKVTWVASVTEEEDEVCYFSIEWTGW